MCLNEIILFTCFEPISLKFIHFTEHYRRVKCIFNSGSERRLY